MKRLWREGEDGRESALNREKFSKQLEWMDAGTALFLEGLSLLDLSAHDKASLLEGWSVAHLIAHVNSNARALENLTVWARTGVVNPMYASNDQRALDIEEGSKNELSLLIEDFRASSEELSRAISSLSEIQLDYKVKSARGRDIPTSEAVWIRIRELWIHAVDLNVGISFSQFPEELVEALLDDVVPSLASRDNVPGLELVATDASRSWKIDGSGDCTRVEGRRADLLAWLVGRSDGTALSFGPLSARAPILPAWL